MDMASIFLKKKKKRAAFTKYPVLLFCRACNHVKISEIGVSKVAKYSLKLFSAICFNCVCHILYVWLSGSTIYNLIYPSG